MKERDGVLRQMGLAVFMLAALCSGGCEPKPEPPASLPASPGEPVHCALVLPLSEVSSDKPACLMSLVVEHDTRAYRHAAHIVFAGEVWGGKTQPDRATMVLNIHGEEAARRLVRYLSLVSSLLEGKKIPKDQNLLAFQKALRLWYTAQFESASKAPETFAPAMEAFDAAAALPFEDAETKAALRIWAAVLVLRHGTHEAAAARLDALKRDSDPFVASAGWMYSARLAKMKGDEAAMKAANEEIVRLYKGKNFPRTVYQAEMALLPPEKRPKPPTGMPGPPEDDGE
jgi:hypothetical protein